LPQTLNKLNAGFNEGLAKGWRSFWWVLKLIVLISFATALIEYSGLIEHLDGVLAPCMKFLGLPTVAALPIVSGCLAGIYAGLAAMAVLPLTEPQMTLVTIFILISHMLIQEGIIQAKSGFGVGRAAMVRLAASILTVAVAARFLDVDTGAAAAPVAVTASQGLAAMLSGWALATGYLALKILMIVMTIMIVLSWMRQFDLIPVLLRWLRPVLALMGLGPRVGMLWLSAVLFGIAYGAAVIVEEARSGEFAPHDLERLHISIGINHSMVEDPVLFLPLGIGAFWLWVPRLVAAMVAVRLYDLWRWLRGRGKAALYSSGGPA